MKIFVAIVHHWNPQGDGLHSSLRPNPEPRRHALQDQLLALRRISFRQGVIDISKMMVINANQAIAHELDIRVVTDGCHTVLDRLEKPYRDCIQEHVCKPLTPKHLGFEAQKLIAEQCDQGFDLLVYLEDDLLILDSFFFHKIFWFTQQMGPDYLLMPHRMEMSHTSHPSVERVFIDGPLPEREQRKLIPEPEPPLAIDSSVGRLFFESPRNPHSGCFALTPEQINLWCEHSCWQDGDCSYVSPLESAATLGLTKVFRLYKPALVCASWLELQHWGTSFRSLVGGVIKPRQSQIDAAN